MLEANLEVPIITLEFTSLALGIIGAFLALISLSLQFKDQPRLVIREFRPVLFGIKDTDSDVCAHKIEYIRLEIENTGSRMAFDVSGLVTFPGLDALPMFPVVDGAFQRELRIFDLKPNQRMELWGTWKKGPADYFGDGHLTPPQFLAAGIPATAKVKHGNKLITKTLTRKEVEKIFQRDQEAVCGRF